MKRKEFIGHVISIISVSLFLIFATTFIYLPKQESLLASFAFLQNQNKFYMRELSSGILLNNAAPVTDESGLKNRPYRFEVVNNSNSDITYQIVFQNNEDKAKASGREVLPNRYLRYALNNVDSEIIEPNTLTDNGVLYTTTIKANSTQIFDFRMWLDYEADYGAMNKIFIGKIEIKEIEK